METVRLGEGLCRTALPGGLAVLSERMPGVRSASLGVWVRAASGHEPPERAGLAHLLEHMVFKGSDRRSVRELAMALEVRGGSLDAFTARDHTAFQAHALDRDLPLAVELLTDLVRRPLLRGEDLESERQVVLEEISAVDDAPDDLIFDRLAAALWPGHPWGRPILGTRESVAAIVRQDLAAFHAAAYHPDNCVIAAAGNLEHEALLELLEREGWFRSSNGRPPLREVRDAAAVQGAELRDRRDTIQTHVAFGTDTFAAGDPRRYALALLANVLGGGMSSRLFQRVREELGLAYAVYAWKQFFGTSGQIGVYVGTRPESADRAVDAIRRELDRLAAEGLTAGELSDARRQLTGQVMLALEAPPSRMSRLASSELYDDRYRSLDEVLRDIEAVTAESVAAVAAEYFPAARQTVVRLGPGA